MKVFCLNNGTYINLEQICSITKTGLGKNKNYFAVVRLSNGEAHNVTEQEAEMILNQSLDLDT
jgi:hypothetical protein